MDALQRHTLTSGWILLCRRGRMHVLPLTSFAKLPFVSRKTLHLLQRANGDFNAKHHIPTNLKSTVNPFFYKQNM